MHEPAAKARPPHRTKKEMAWERKRHKVDKIADGLGLGVDEGIKETVVALLMYGISTEASCEGHLDWGHPYPWIHVSTPEPKGWKRKKAIEQQWVKENLKQQRRLLELLSSFYRRRNPPFDARLVLHSWAFGGFRIQSIGAEIVPLLSSKKRQAKLILYQKEMESFAAFLRKQYLRDP